jgi:alginate O-acetyltransferase complex protein AlgI
MNQILQEIFLYNPDKPLIFTRLFFWGFYGVVLLIYSGIYRHRALRNAFLFLASLFFYWKTSGLFFLILVFSTVTDFYLGNLLSSTFSCSPISSTATFLSTRSTICST